MLKPRLAVSKLRRPAMRLARQLGVPYDSGNSHDWFNGRTVGIGIKRPIEDSLHDVAHWLMAHESRRGVVNFGLGQSPGESTPDRIKSPLLVSEKRREREEVCSSAFGIALMLWSGASIEEAVQNFRYHSWPFDGHLSDGRSDIARAFRRARRRGIEVPKSVVDHTYLAYDDYVQTERNRWLPRVDDE